MFPYKGTKKIFIALRERDYNDKREFNSSNDYVLPIFLWTFLIWIEDTK